MKALKSLEPHKFLLGGSVDRTAGPEPASVICTLEELKHELCLQILRHVGAWKVESEGDGG